MKHKISDDTINKSHGHGYLMKIEYNDMKTWMWKESETSIEYKIKINFETKFPEEGEYVMPHLRDEKSNWMKSLCIYRNHDLILIYHGWCLFVN